MIIGIGCDIVDHKLAKKLNWTADDNFINRVFSFQEKETYNKNKKVSFLTGRFAAKEAVLKCLGTGMYDGLSLKDIEIIQLENGQPKIQLKGEVRKISNKLGINKWFISISHSLTSSIAKVIAEGQS